ncbi:tyrosine-type recombinase/integrase [Actinomycetospora straminea]|uniref:Tyrosine-type recombinase/integrase n=1 Tax=Actinomycetospora straminea TaxID=663607 RepID=A0ABP9E5W1_9PSEU|nr:tyrosine-type recombinase/integrase [Actinomycetospora straminea]MDD7931383.1 tyrosine-type recombinase/integrase [Actinomycetospora straminea]
MAPERETTLDVRVWGVKKREGARGTTYRVRWIVAGHEWHDSFPHPKQADGFRSELVSAIRRGEPFDLATGRPVSSAPEVAVVTWFELACDYVDMKWPRQAGKSRRGIAESLTTTTPVLLTTDRGRPDDDVLRATLYAWAFNAPVRAAGPPADEEMAAAARWLAQHTVPVSALADTVLVRAVLDRFTLRLDGTPASASTVTRKRATFFNIVEYAVERELLRSNPLRTIRWSAPKLADTVNPRAVVNPAQARSLLEAVKVQGKAGPALVAFFAAIYYAALRPAEAVELRRDALTLPEDGWGELYLTGSAPETGRAWTGLATRREPRGLKHRGRQDVRIVPAPPPLVRLLRDHLDSFGVDRQGRLFRGARGGPLAGSVYQRVWRDAREKALTASEVASPLARRPYDLRHAAVSTWLNSGVPAPQVAEWAGHSVNVLLRVYAKCIVGQEDEARRRIIEALGEDPS